MTDISGWRKRQIALDQKAENARELGLDYGWVGLTDEEFQYCVELKNPEAIIEEVEAKLKEKNT
jgi:hypothetical protein